jgi:hypothetical protein
MTGLGGAIFVWVLVRTTASHLSVAVTQTSDVRHSDAPAAAQSRYACSKIRTGAAPEESFTVPAMVPLA